MANAAPNPITNEIAHPAVANRRGRAPDLLQVQFVPGQEDQEGQAQIGQSGHHTVQVGQIEDIGADENAQPDLDHDLGYGQPPGQLRQDRCQHGSQGDQYQGADGGRRHTPPPDS
jgi:hypothetical protein